MEPSQSTITDLGVAFVGNVDAGKSTLIGVLTTGKLDNGNGSARVSVAKHQHEIDSGKTSDISTRNLKSDSGKNVTLIDLCGHEKYLKTTTHGISGLWPDYGVVIISPTRGILEMTRQHFRLLMSYNIPIFVVITRIDIAVEDSYNNLELTLKKLCSRQYSQTVEFINTYKDYHKFKAGEIPEGATKDSHVEKVLKGLQLAGGKQSYVPVITVSNVDGYYIDVMRKIMDQLTPRDLWKSDEGSNRIIKFFKTHLKDEATLEIIKKNESNEYKGTMFYIDTPFNPIGIGITVSGIVRGDGYRVGDTAYVGPFGKLFHEVKIRSMHNDIRQEVDFLGHHHRGCIAIKFKDTKLDIKKNNIKKGMVLLSHKEMFDNISYNFRAAISIFGSHSATLRDGYSPVIHVGTIRQTVKMTINNKDRDKDAVDEIDEQTVETKTNETSEQIVETRIDELKTEEIQKNEDVDDTTFTKREKKIIDKHNGGRSLSTKTEETPVIDTIDKRTLTKRERKAMERKLKSGDVEVVSLKFAQKPEYIEGNNIFIFRSGEIHGIGMVVDSIPLALDENAHPEPQKRKVKKPRFPPNANNIRIQKNNKESIKIVKVL